MDIKGFGRELLVEAFSCAIAAMILVFVYAGVTGKSWVEVTTTFVVSWLVATVYAAFRLYRKRSRAEEN